jgi:transcriptional antiterminator, BglG family
MSTQSETFDVNLARFILSKIKQVENYLHAELPYPYNVNIFSHLYIMIERLNKWEQKANQSQISFENGSHFDQQLLQISRRIMTDISEYLGRKIADIEVSYLYQYLYSSRFQLDAAQQKIQFSQRVMLVTQFYLEKMDMTKGKHIDKNSPMFIDLANHISPLLRRLDNRIRIKNKMLEEIQKNYSIIYQQTVAVSQEMTKSFGFSHISSDEIGFLTLYFVRFREMSQQPIQTVIMCSSGIGISELLRMKIETEFKDLDIVDVVSAQNARQVLASHPEIKLIITSVDIPVDLDVKHILVSALMTDEDKEKIAKAIQEIHYGD